MACKYSNIVVSPQELRFTIQEGAKFIPPYQSVALKKEQAGELAPLWDAIANADWISFTPRSGEAPESIRVNVRLGVAVGTYHGQIVISSSSTILPSPIVKVTLEVTAKPEPEPDSQPQPPQSWLSKLLDFLLALVKSIFQGGRGK